MRIIAALLMSLISAGYAGLSHADQLQFTGNTTADVPLIKDALRNVQIYAQARMKCERLEKVVAEVLPKDFSRPGPPGPEQSPATYERWLVTLCGTNVPFLISFWPAAQGGTMFNVTEFPQSK